MTQRDSLVPVSSDDDLGDEIPMSDTLNGENVDVPTPKKAERPTEEAIDRGQQKVDEDALATGRTTPLIRACKGGHKHTAIMLVEGGANVDIKDEEGRTALMFAALFSRDADIVVALLKVGARVTDRCNQNRTCVSYAAANPYTDTCALSLTHPRLHKFFVNAADKNGRTAISYAAEAGHVRACAALVAAGATPSGRSVVLEPPEKKGEPAKLTLQKSAPKRSPLSFAAENGHEDVVAFLLKHADNLREAENYVDINDFKEVPKKTNPVAVLSASGALALVMYVFFVILFSVAMHYSRDPLYAFQLNEFMKDLVLNEEFSPDDSHIYKSFYDVASYEEFWQYLKGPLAGALQDNDGTLYGYNRLIGVARIRQLRVKKNSCGVMTPHNTIIQDCYPPYSQKKEMRDAIGSGGNITYKFNSHYSIKDLGLSETYPVQGWLSVYLGGGYIIDLKGVENDSLLLEQAEQEEWIGAETRAVFVDFTTYNPNVNLFFNAQLIFEFLPSGGVFPYAVFRTFRIDNIPTMELVCTIIMVVVVLFCFLFEIKEIAMEGTAYFSDGWNMLDLLNILLFIVSFILLLVIQEEYKSLTKPWDQDKFYDFTTIRYYVSTNFNIRAVNSFLLWFKVFKYTSFSKETTIMVETVKESIRRLTIVVLCTSIMIIGFAQAGQLAFGVDVAAYRDFTSALLSSIKALLGDFSFDELYQSSRVAGPLYYALFIVLFFFILLNIFIAVVSKAYDEVEESNRAVEGKIEDVLYTKYQEYAPWIQDDRNEVDEAVEALFSADRDGDMRLNLKEVEALYKNHAYEELLQGTDAVKLMQTYDINADGYLDHYEQSAMMDSLHNKKEQNAMLRQAEAASQPASLRNIDDPPARGVAVDDSFMYARLNFLETQMSDLNQKMDTIMKMMERR